jgi:hypothetical protein
LFIMLTMNWARLCKVLFLAVATLTGAAACSPTFDWREMPVAQGRARVLFPAKPVTATREITLAGKGYAMTLTGARVAAAQFAAGSITCAPADAPQAAQAWAQAMLKNIDATSSAVTITLPNAQGALEAQGQGMLEGKPTRLHARFAWRGDQVYGVIAAGPVQDLSAEHAKQFAHSLVLP